MIAKRDRRPLHLAAAEHLRKTYPNDGEEMAEMIATHLLDAYRAATGDPDAEALRADAVAALRRAARRAGTIGARETAERILRSAIDLTEDDRERADLLEEAGWMAQGTGRHVESIELFKRAVSIHEAAGRELEAASLAGPLGLSLRFANRTDEAEALLRAALESLGEAEWEPAAARVNFELSRVLSGRDGPSAEEAAALLARAADIAEALEMHDLIARTLNDHAIQAMAEGRYEEARVLYDGGAALAERHRLPERFMLMSNSADLQVKRDMPDAISACEACVAAARELGARFWEELSLGNLIQALIWHGRWEEAERIGHDALADAAGRSEMPDAQYTLGLLEARRGAVESARHRVAAIASWADHRAHENRQIHDAVAGMVALAGGQAAEAFELLERAAREAMTLTGASADGMRIAWGEAVDAALALGRVDRVEGLVELLASQPRRRVPPLLRAELERGQGRLHAAREEHEEVESHLSAAARGFTELGYPFWLSRAQADLAEWMIERGRGPESTALLDEAAAALEELGAEPLLGRVRELQARIGAGSDAARPAPIPAG
jgi:tetratricopeptide (TPR) repeat protein